MLEIVNTLKKFDALRDEDHTQTDTTGRINPNYASKDVFDNLNGQLKSRLYELGINRLYSHQSEAIKHALAAENVVLEAPTASGKTLSFAVPVLENLIADRNSHALFIYPMKAVAMDQRAQLLKLHKGLFDAGNMPIESWTYDGDVSASDRKLLREWPISILMTNIEFINYSFLAHSDLWEQFLQNLKWVVVDEIHEYRGYFGTNASMVLRRLVHYLNSKGSNPNFFLATATCANPIEHAENLTGLKFVEVSARESLKPKRDYLFVDPEIPNHMYWNVLQLRSAKTALALGKLGKSAIIFCPTRKFAEQAYRQTMSALKESNDDVSTVLVPDNIRVYKGGMNPEDRHEIMEGLNNGNVKIVFSTNALELGIDVPGLDAVVMVGFPDNVMSARQQLGRAGRNWQSDGLVIYYARNNPLDSFYARNLQAFLNKPLDEIVIDAGNEEIAEPHATCVLFESGPENIDGSADILGKGISKVAITMKKEGRVPVRNGRYRPHRSVDIRGGGEGVFNLERDGTSLGTISSYQKFKEAYDRAIILHGGSKYRVARVSSDKEGKRIIELTIEGSNHRTDAFANKSIQINDLFDGLKWDKDLETWHGGIYVYEYIQQVSEIDEATDQVVDKWQLDSSSSSFHSSGHAFWLSLLNYDVASSALVALEQIMRVGVRFNIPVDEHDTYTVYRPRERDIYIVESYPGGIGIVKKVAERWQDVLGAGMKVALNCKCRSGCPYCIVPPRRTEEIDKVAGLRLAYEVLKVASRPASHEFVQGTWKPLSRAHRLTN